MIAKKWMTVIGATVLTGVLATSVALAANSGSVAEAVSSLSPGVQQLMEDIRSLREQRLQELKTEVDGLIDKAQTEGKITADEATQLKERGVRGRGMKGGHGRFGHFGSNLTEDQVKAQLDEAVTNGRITQEHADQMLQKWQEWNAAETDKQG